jgi:predicted kinase
VLIIFGGLPGAGKTTIARELARQIGAMHLRIDSIEQAIRSSVRGLPSLDEAGYRVAYAIAEDNLRIGRTVVADSVNPLSITRDAWLKSGGAHEWIRSKLRLFVQTLLNTDPAWKGGQRTSPAWFFRLGRR